MPKPQPNTEIEIKLRVGELLAMRRLLKQLGACEITPRTYESNTLYDTPAGELRRRGKIIRVRIEQPASARARSYNKERACATLTYKAPIRSLQHARKLRPAGKSKTRFKIKEEAEISPVDADQVDEILRGLGLHPSFRYEKYRTTYALPGIRGLRVDLDETPIGTFLELEGSPAGIDRAASRLGYSRSEYITSTYGALYLADCKRRGQKPAHMLFH